MKRLIASAVGAVALLVVTAGTALADYPPVPGNGGGEPPPPPAFTGASISLGLIVAGVLLFVGVAALVAGRRRAGREAVPATGPE